MTWMEPTCCILIVFTIGVVCMAKLVGTERSFSYASYFESNMVLQMAPARASVWGYAPSASIGDVVSINLTSKSQTLRAYTTKILPGAGQGIWKVVFDPISDVKAVYAVHAGLKSHQPIILTNILFGDVWICSGQSNMKFRMDQMLNASEEIAAASKYQDIRFFSVAQVESIVPVFDLAKVEIHWSLPSASESNTNHNMDVYNCTFPAMINDWRQKWNNSTDGRTDILFPFGFVQIGPTSGNPAIRGYADIRWHQTADVGFVPNSIMQNVFMAVSFDLTDKVGKVHYRDKETISKQLALSGLAVAYCQPITQYNGPYPTLVNLDRRSHTISVLYDDGTTALVIHTHNGFEVCCKKAGCPMSGSDWLPAPIVARDVLSVITLNASNCMDMTELTGLRYGWRETPFQYLLAAVYSKVNSLPAPPFITFLEASTLHLQWNFLHKI